MLFNNFRKLVLTLLFISTAANAEILCDACEVEWVRTEKSNGDLVFATTSGIGTGPCVGTQMTTRGIITERQKDQMMSMLLAALVSGAKIRAEGDDTPCGSLTSITVKKP